MYTKSEIKRIWFFLIILFAIILCGCSSSKEKEKWNLKLLEEVPYSNISSEFIGTGIAPITYITDSEINFFTYDKQCFLDLNTLHFELFGSRGKGPGEFQYASNMIEIGDKRYCVDESKMSMMIFNAQNEFLKEIKLDYPPSAIFKLSDNKLGILHPTYSSDKTLINIYSLDGKFIEEIVPAPKSLYGYEAMLSVNFLYGSAYCVQKGDYIYIFLRGIPVVHKYNLKTKQNEFINYKNDLPFEPTKPFIKLERESSLKANLFVLLLVKEYNNYLIFKATNRKDIHEGKIELCLFRFNFINDGIEIIEIVNKDEIVTKDPLSYFNSWAIYDKKLYIFDDTNETLLIYEIIKEE